jgi:hypothetical protein
MVIPSWTVREKEKGREEVCCKGRKISRGM